ncbi:MAG: type I restriction endonuclease subunit R [Acidimicrobiaceae bacterium]|nr:type I restriction endonuclease subunit R [Acidimicrobiaceae bacterium]
MAGNAKLSEFELAERPALELLQRLGWRHVPHDALALERGDERNVLLEGRLTAALKRLNPWMGDDDAHRVIFNLRNIDATGLARNQAVHEYLSHGMPLTVDRAGRQETPTVRFFDFEHAEPGHNEYVVTTQFRVRAGSAAGAGSSNPSLGGQHAVIPDLVLFVNGMPLVVMEAKSPTLIDIWKSEAVKQLHRYQEAGPQWHGAGAPELFDTNLLCVVHCGSDAAFGALGAPARAYTGWRSIEPFSEHDFERRLGTPPQGQARLIAGLLNPVALLDVLRDFVVYGHEQGRLTKKLPRHQQHRAVTRAIKRIRAGNTPGERGGVVWHTQGSGKSLTMLWLATKLRRTPALGNPAIVVVTDRTQLDQQITRTFAQAAVDTPERATRTSHLRDLLTRGSGRTIMTTIHKFEDALDGQATAPDPLNDAANIVVMVDEAHRTQYGRLAAKMRAAMPHAAFVGFTGTPIDKGFRRTTLGVFGDLIDSYTIPQSVEDRATVPIHYEARLADLHIEGPQTLDRLFETLFGDETEQTRTEIRRRYASKDRIAEAAKRIEAIALDISEHFKAKIKPNGFKAQVVAPSRAAALRYSEHLNNFGVAAYPVITTLHNDGPEFAEAKQLDQDKIVKDFIDPDGEPQMLVVVDMLITGFDAPVEQVLYLDKSIREHALLQAIARVNRRFSHTVDGTTTEKHHGLIVDYHGVSHELESALAVFDHGDVRQALTPLEDPAPVISAAADRAEAHFRGLDLDDQWACVNRFAAVAIAVIDAVGENDGEYTADDSVPGSGGGYKADAYERFDADYRDLARLMDRYLPEPAALAYLDRLQRLTVIRSYVRAQFLRESADIDWTAVGAKVKHLLDSRIDADVRRLMKPVSVLDRDFDSKIAGLAHDEARASVMEHSLRAHINERVSENPALYEQLSEALERIMRELRDKVIDAAEGCKRMAELRSRITRQQADAEQRGLTAQANAVYDLLDRAADHSHDPDDTQDTADEKASESARRRAEGGEPGAVVWDVRTRNLTLEISAVMETGRSVIDWRDNLDVLREMRRDIKRILRSYGRHDSDETDKLVRQIMEVARARPR